MEIESPTLDLVMLSLHEGDRRESEATSSPSRALGGSIETGAFSVELSERALAALQGGHLSDRADRARERDSSGPDSDRAAGSEAARPSEPGELSEEEEQEVRRLRARDVEVRTHENAHKAAAGRHARGGPEFELERGPDGRRYAVGGEVSIDTSPVENDPDATILKMQQVRRAALAPADPSSQDRKVASEAARAEATARAEKREEQASESSQGVARSYASGVEDRRGSELDLSV